MTIDDGDITRHRDYVIHPSSSNKRGEEFIFEHRTAHFKEKGDTRYKFGYASSVDDAKKHIDSILDKPVVFVEEDSIFTQPVKQKSRVFIINQPLKKDPATGAMEKWLPMESAAKFGEVVEILPAGSPPAALDGWIATLRAALKDFREEDYIVLVGDQSLLLAAAAIVGWSDNGKLRALKWDRRLDAYAPVLLDFGTAP